MTITPEQARRMRKAMMASEETMRELMDPNHPGHELAIEEWRALGELQHGHLPREGEDFGAVGKPLQPWEVPPKGTASQPAPGGAGAALLNAPTRVADAERALARRAEMTRDPAMMDALHNGSHEQHTTVLTEWRSLGETILAGQQQ